MKITIAGAGIGGLAAAISLAQRGHSVQLFEASAELGEVGAGIQISPNGMAVLRALGIEEALGEVSLQASQVILLDGLSGNTVLTMDLAKHAPDLRWQFVHRAQLIDTLATAAKSSGVSVNLGQRITPPASYKALDGDDLFIGAEGLHSETRAALNGSKPADFTRQVAWRATIHETGDPFAEVHMGPGRHLVSYPLKGGLRNIVAVEERETWAAESWRQEDDPANMRQAFQNFSSRVQHWLDQVETVHLWGLFRHPVAKTWFAGQQVLLGDAAHPTLPFLAQGANMALEDAWTLAACVDDPVGGLQRYQDNRRPRSERIVQAATANARNYHLAFPPLRFLAHNALRVGSALSPKSAMRRFDWLYRHDVTA